MRRRRPHASPSQSTSRPTPPVRQADPTCPRGRTRALVESLEGRVFLSAGPAEEEPGVNILVKFAAGAGDAERRQIIAAHGLSASGRIDAIDVDLLAIAPGASPHAVVKNLKGL